jgi:pimeloyl-ACP methyl ester carboxylesterase
MAGNKRTNLFFPLFVLFLSAALWWLSWYQVSTYNNKLAVRYKSYGDATKETIVLVPGLDGATAFFADIVPELTPQYHVVVYNLPLCARGCDESAYTFEYLASDLHSVISELKLDQITLVGESFGGIIAQHYAHQHSDKLKRMVLMSSLARTLLPADIKWKLDNLMPIIGTLGHYFPHFAQFLFAQIHVDDVIEPGESAEVRQLFIKEASFAHFYSVLARIKITAKLDILDLLRTITTPTLVIHGEDDHFTSKDSVELHARLHNSMLRSLPGGHLAHTSQPKEFAAMVAEFVQSSF